MRHSVKVGGVASHAMTHALPQPIIARAEPHFLLAVMHSRSSGTVFARSSRPKVRCACAAAEAGT